MGAGTGLILAKPKSHQNPSFWRQRNSAIHPGDEVALLYLHATVASGGPAVHGTYHLSVVTKQDYTRLLGE